MAQNLDQPLISIVLPVYNAAEFLAETLASIQAQTYANWELIIVNDGSIDSTEAVVQAATIPASQLQYLTQANAGPGAARNRGIAAAHGDWVAFIDGDDRWTPDKLEHQMTVAADWDVIFSNGRFIGDHHGEPFVTAVGQFSGQQMFAILYQHNRIPLLSVLARKAVLGAVGGFKSEGLLSRKCEDYDLWLRLAQADCRFCGLADRLVEYRIHPGSSTKQTLLMTQAELAVVAQYDETMSREHPADWHRRQRDLLNRLAAAAASAGDMKLARDYLTKLTAHEARWRVGYKRILLRTFDRRYGAVYDRLLR